MAGSLSARVTRPSSPATIEDDLAVLWRDAGRDAPVARALLANLVVYRDRPATEDVDLGAPNVLVGEVAERHPSRTIVLHHGGRPDLCGPFGATISILLFGPPQARYGVEEIAVQAACAEASLPSIVRRLALGDMPTSIWWTEDLSKTTPLEALVTMGRQFVYDSRQWRDLRRGVLAVAPLATGPRATDVADLNWRRLTPMRQALTQALATSTRKLAAPRVAAASLRVRHRPGDGALAWLLAGWFGASLGWPADAEWPIAIEEGRRGDEVLGVALDRDEIAATMNGHRVLVRYKERTAPFSVAVPHETHADAVASELRSLTYDVCLRDALAALAARFTASKSP